MSIESQLQELETDIENVKKTVRRYELLEKLEDSPEWKELIEDGYFRDEAARVVGLRGDLQMRMGGELQMQWLDDMLTGIGALQQYLNFIKQTGSAAKHALEEDQETRAELLKAQLESGVQ
jgi:hypothetical protein